MRQKTGSCFKDSGMSCFRFFFSISSSL